MGKTIWCTLLVTLLSACADSNLPSEAKSSSTQPPAQVSVPAPSPAPFPMPAPASVPPLMNAKVTFASGMYQPLLGRDASSSEISNWNAIFASSPAPDCAGTAHIVLDSAEFTTYSATLNNRDYISALYRGLLSREPDAAGLSAWMAELTANQITRANLAAQFLGSAEFVSLCHTQYGF